MLETSSQELVQNLLSRPNAPIILSEVEEKLAEERKKRAAFYDEVTDEQKAEFINGEIIIHSPVKKEHNDVSGRLHNLLNVYVKKNKLGYVGIEKVMISLSRNDYEPDLCFFSKEKSQKFKKGQSLFPSPDLVVEILSKGTAKNDRGIKFDDYQAHRVKEYWIIDPMTKTVEQYRLGSKSNTYELILKASQGTIECKPITGFIIPIEAIFDDARNLEVLTNMLTK